MNRKTILKALSWSFIGTYGNQGILFIVGIILARILDPVDFGIIAMILVFYNFSQILIDLGFSNAIIQSKTNTQDDLSTIFYLNIGFGLLFSLIFFFSGELIASFFNLVQLKTITKVFSLIFVLFALSSIQRTLIIKKLDFKSEAKIMMFSSVVSGCTAIFLALRGFGVWALLVKIILQRFFETLLFWLKSRWRPSFVFKIDSIKKYFRFSMNITAATLLNGLTQNIDRLIIGKIFSAETLGFFDRSKKYNDLSRSNIANIFGKVMFPVFSEIQDNDEKFKSVYKKIIGAICFFSIPFFLVLILIARPLIIVLITDKWLPSVKLLQILALSGFTYPVSMVIAKAIAAKGRADVFFRLDVYKTTLFLVGIAAGTYWGVVGVVTAISIAGFAGLAINSVALGRIIRLKIRSQVRVMLAPLIHSAIMFLILIVVGRLIDMDNYQKLIILPIVGMISYFGLNYFFNHKQVAELSGVLQSFRKTKKMER